MKNFSRVTRRVQANLVCCRGRHSKVSYQNFYCTLFASRVLVSSVVWMVFDFFFIVPFFCKYIFYRGPGICWIRCNNGWLLNSFPTLSLVFLGNCEVVATIPHIMSFNTAHFPLCKTGNGSESFNVDSKKFAPIIKHFFLYNSSNSSPLKFSTRENTSVKS